MVTEELNSNLVSVAKVGRKEIGWKRSLKRTIESLKG